MTPEDRIRMALGGLLFDNIMLQGRVEEMETSAAQAQRPQTVPAKKEGAAK